MLGRGESGDIRLTVSNTGEPIPEEIVEQFNREVELSQAGSGHGWGLNIIRSAASEIGASIEAHAAGEDGGAEFEVSFSPHGSTD